MSENNNIRNRIFTLGAYSFKYEEFIELLKRFPPLKDLSELKEVDGPFDGKINSMYAITLPDDSKYLLRCRISKVFRYEPIVKEKILYPFLDGTLSIDTPDLGSKIKEITNKHSGSYIFSDEHPPIVPVQNLLYYYEPARQFTQDWSINNKEGDTIIPYITTIKDFIPGISMYELLKEIPESLYDSPAILGLFERAGRLLAKLHNQIQFDSFYEKITDIGSDKKNTWISLFKRQWELNLKDASRFPGIRPYLEDLKRYYDENLSIVEEDTEAVFFHNDYQTQNIIIRDNFPEKDNYDNPDKYEIVAVIDFDNWRIGPRAQDFVKMEYWSIKGNKPWKDAFYKGYSDLFKISEDMKRRIEIYKVLWFMLVYAFEMDKIMKNETNITVDNRFPSADIYIEEIKKYILD